MTTLTIQRAYKVEIAPTELQARELARHVGVCRWVYNWTLATRQERWRHGGRAGKELNRELTGRIDHHEAPAWIGVVSAVARREAQKDVDTGYKNAFDRLKKGAYGKKIGWPRMRNRRHERYWYSVSGGGRCELERNPATRRDYIGMVGITGPVRVKEFGYLPDRPVKTIQCAYSRVSGRHYLSVSYEVEAPGNRGSHAGGDVGIDVGSKTALTLSDGRTFQSPRPLQKLAAKLARAQRSVARKYESRKNRNGTVGTKAQGPMGTSESKARARVAKIHADISAARRDWQNKLTAQLVKHYRTIRVEDLSLQGMARTGKGSSANPGSMVRQKAGRNRKLLDIGIGEIFRELEYKGQWYGCGFEKVDRFFPSTQLCSACGAKTGPHGQGQLNIRQWACPECGTVHDRDENAAVNIRDFPHWSKASDGRWRRDPALETLGRPRTEQPCHASDKAEHTVDHTLVGMGTSPLAAEGDEAMLREAKQVGAVWSAQHAGPVDHRRPASREGGIAIRTHRRERSGAIDAPAPARNTREPQEATRDTDGDDRALMIPMPERRSHTGPYAGEIIA